MYRNFGATNQLIYDNCAYQMDLRMSTNPGEYRLYLGQAENENKCILDGRVYFRQDPCVVDAESELRNIKRPVSMCDRFKYNPKCAKSYMCNSTFDPSNPLIPDPSVCPIVYNNIARPNGPGFNVQNIVWHC